MSEETICSIENYIAHKIQNNTIKSLGVSWYGGEPLLSKKVIERLSKTFIKVNNYKATLFTNGYAFNDTFINNLLNYKISLVHFTLDGPRKIHDKYRFLKNKNGTFNKIKENIIKIINKHGKNISINIRTNLDNDNKEYYSKLIDEFQDFKDYKISFQFHKIKEFKTGASANYCGEMVEDEFKNVYMHCIKILIDNKYKKPIDFFPKNLNFQHCYVGMDNGFTIGYDGSIYKCFGDANPPQNKIGQLLKNGEIEFIDEAYFKWYGYDYYEDVNCRSCVLLPICMGGCAHQRLGLTPGVPAKCDKNIALNHIINLIKEVYKLKIIENEKNSIICIN